MTKLKITGLKLVVGFVLLLVIIGGVLRSQCPSATDRANAITMEDIQRSGERYKRAKALGVLRQQLEASRPDSPERDAIIDAMIATFDPAIQARMRALTSRGDRLDAIKIEIQKDTANAIAKTKAMEPHFWCK